jgi:hypothetical protein
MGQAVEGLRTDPGMAERRLADAKARESALRMELDVARGGVDAATDEGLARVADLEQQLASATSAARAAAADVDAGRRADGEGSKIVGRALALMDDLAIISGQLRELRVSAGVDVDMDPMVARFDRLHATLESAMSRFGHVDDVLGNGDQGQLFRVRAVWEAQRAEVQAERADLSERYVDADRVAGGIIRVNFARLTERFASSVLGADIGIVNVFWSDLTETDSEIRATRVERNRAEADLKRRYAYLEQNLDKKTRPPSTKAGGK